MSQGTFFGADFADYPFMCESVVSLATEVNLIIGGQGRSGTAAEAAALACFDYFDWRDYFRSGDFEHELDPLAVVDPSRIRRYESAKPSFMRSLDRVFIKPEPYLLQERFFYQLICALEAWVRAARRPLTVVFAHTPHFPWHIVFHRVCEVLDVPVYILRTTQIADAMLIDAALSHTMQRWTRPQTPINREWVMRWAWSRSPRLQNAVSINRRSERHARKQLRPEQWLAIAWRYFQDRRYLRRHAAYRLSWRDAVAAAIRRHRTRLADLAYLDRRGLREPPEAPFVYFGLHYQPERTTVPEAGYFHDQVRAIQILAASLPADMTLVVKEHPRQLGDRRPTLRRLHAVRRPVYEAIERIPNAVLMHAYVDSGTLIRQAWLTASCTGSAVFEGLQAGVPGLTFACTWHSDCASGPFCRDACTVREVLPRLLAKTAEEVTADFRRFLYDRSCWWFLGANNDEAVMRSKLPRETLCNSVATALRRLTQDASSSAPMSDRLSVPAMGPCESNDRPVDSGSRAATEKSPGSAHRIC